VVRRHWPLGAIVAGLLLVCVAGLLAAGVGSVRQVAAPRATVPIIPDHAFPAVEPSPQVTHEGVRVRMPELGIDLPVVEGDGLTAPLYEAAHYPGMSWPGEGGRSLLYAHARTGMFGPLFRAHVGEEVDVDRPGAATLRYVIRAYDDHWPATDTSILQTAGHEELILLTCTTYNPSDPRIVVFAEPAP
jgi:LPXTG-site transpeptidase (sortase) family protein